MLVLLLSGWSNVGATVSWAVFTRTRAEAPATRLTGGHRAGCVLLGRVDTSPGNNPQMVISALNVDWQRMETRRCPRDGPRGTHSKLQQGHTPLGHPCRCVPGCSR